MPKADKLLESLEWFATILTGGYGVGDVVHDLTSEITDAIDLTGPGGPWPTTSSSDSSPLP